MDGSVSTHTDARARTHTHTEFFEQSWICASVIIDVIYNIYNDMILYDVKTVKPCCAVRQSNPFIMMTINFKNQVSKRLVFLFFVHFRPLEAPLALPESFRNL